jgi:hypothetical protein
MILEKTLIAHLECYAGIFKAAVGAKLINTELTPCDAGTGEVTLTCSAQGCIAKIIFSKSGCVLSSRFSDSGCVGLRECREDLGLTIKTR